MKYLRQFLAGLVVLLFSGVLTPVSFATPANFPGDNSGLKYDVYKNLNVTGTARSTTAHTLCASGAVQNIDDMLSSSTLGCPNTDYVMVHYYGYISYPTARTVSFANQSDDGFFATIGGTPTIVDGRFTSVSGATTIINDWNYHACNVVAGSSFTFEANRWYPIDAWFFEWGGGQCSRLLYNNLGSWQPVPNTVLSQVGTTPVSFTDESVVANAPRGVAYSSEVVAANGGTRTYSVQSGGSLPPGLTLNANGTITGTPTTKGSYSFIIDVQGNDNGTISNDSTPTLTITVGDAPDVSSSTLDAAVAPNTPITEISYFDSVADPAATYTVATGSLPAGLTLNASTGVISGTPTTKQTKTFTITATNSMGSSTTSATQTITVGQAPSISSIDYAGTSVSGSTMTSKSFADAAAYPAPTYEVTDGQLPTGVTLNPSTGLLSGQSTVEGVHTFVVTASNRFGSSSTGNVSLTVGKAPTFPSTVSIHSLPHAAITTTSFADPDAFPVPTYEIASGSELPDGLELSSDGLLTGSPTTPGVFHFSVTATNAMGSATSPVATVIVGYAPDISEKSVDSTITHDVEIFPIDLGDAHAFPTPTYSISDGVKPRGISLNSSTGVLSGTAIDEGVHTFTVTAENIFGSSTTTTLTLAVNRESYFSDGYSDLADFAFVGDTDSPYSSRIAAGGYPAATYSIVDDPDVAGNSVIPPGMSFNTSTGRLSGTPTAAGVYTFRIHAENGVGNGSTTRTQTIVAATSPAVTFQEIATDAYVDIPYDEQPTFSGYPTPTLTLDGDLPAGLSMRSNGTVTGTPTQSGTFRFRECATVFDRTTCTSWFSLVVHPEPVYHNASGLPATAEVGTPYSGHVHFKGKITAWQIAAFGDGLPPGLSIGTDGIISGTPTQTGIFHFKVIATSSSRESTTSPEQVITVRKVPTWTRQTLGIPTTPINQNFASYVSALGYPSPVYAIASGALPKGIALDPNTGELAGKPTAHGAYTFTISATNVVGTITSAPITLLVTQHPVGVDTTVALTGLRNSAFADGITYDAYPEPTYSIVAGALPPGLSLNPSTGAITGTPTSLGDFSFQIQVASPNFYTQTSPVYKLAIQQAPVAIDKTIVARTNMDAAYEDEVVTEAFPAATYSVTAGTLPVGLSISSSTGKISGTATQTGEFTFTITAKNLLGTVAMPLTLSVYQPPTKPVLTLPPNFVVGEAVNGYVSTEGYPLPTFFVASGALPDGVTLNKTTGKLTGAATKSGKYTFSIGALSIAGSNMSTPFTLEVFEPGANFDVKASVGDEIAGASVQVQSEGLLPGAPYKVVLRSTPQTVAQGTTTRAGSILANFVIPNGLEPGWHSTTLTTEAADGSTFEEVAWFEITASGILETVSDAQPSAAEMKSALTDDEAFYEDLGIDPGTQVAEEVVQEKVTEVTSVVASVALVSAAAAATAAVASASAAAAAASAAGAASSAGAAASAAGGAGAAAGGTSSSSSAGARTASPGSSSSGSSGSSGGGGGGGSARGGSTGGSSSGGSGGGSSSGGSSNSSGGSSGGDGSGDDAEYGSLEVEHDDFTTEHTSWGDRLAWWTLPIMTWLDAHSVTATHWSTRFSPVLSRIINDGSYLRAMIGSLMGLLYVAAIGIGVFAVNPGAEKMALSGNVALLTVIVVFGAFDAFAGILGMSAFTIATLIHYPIEGLSDLRYLLAVFISGFAPIILSTTFRKIRRPHMESLMDVWERVVDVFMIAFISSLTTLSLIGGISAYAGATVPLADNANTIVALVTGVALVRIGLEELAARGFAGRLDRINPTEVDGPPMVQQWVSLVFKYAVLVVMIGDMVGWGWWLWLGAFIMFIPGIMGMTLTDLPKSKILSQVIPGGLAALLFATLLSGWSSDLVGMLFGTSPMYGQLSFLLVPLPVIIVAIVGMFADGSEKWYIERKLTWVYLVGGVVVFSWTVIATDFFGQIFGG